MILTRKKLKVLLLLHLYSSMVARLTESIHLNIWLLFFLQTYPDTTICAKARKVLALLFGIYMVVQPLFLVATPHFFDPTISGALLSSMHRTLSKDIDLLESVQKFDLHMCTKQWDSRNYHKTLFESLYCFQNCPQFVLFPSKHNYFVPFVRCVHHKDYLFRHPFPRTNPFSFFLYLQYISTWNI